MQYLWSFVIGGLICVVGQLLIDYTKLTPARILVCYVVTGVALTGIGVYEPLVKFAGAGATVPLTGFGYAIAKGVRQGGGQQRRFGRFNGRTYGYIGRNNRRNDFRYNCRHVL